MKSTITRKQVFDKIKSTNYANFMDIIESIRLVYVYPEDSLLMEWYKDDLFHRYKLKVTFYTCGFSDNEAIIKALLKNLMWQHFWYSKWERGGTHEFDIDPANCNFMLVSDYCKQNNSETQIMTRK